MSLFKAPRFKNYQLVTVMLEELPNRSVKHIKKDDWEMEDDLRTEYDLKGLRVRRMGSERKSFGNSTVRLEPDVAAIFSSAEAVNEALRFLIRVTKNNQPPDFVPEPNTMLEWTNDTL